MPQRRLMWCGRSGTLLGISDLWQSAGYRVSPASRRLTRRRRWDRGWTAAAITARVAKSCAAPKFQKMTLQTEPTQNLKHLLATVHVGSGREFGLGLALETSKQIRNFLRGVDSRRHSRRHSHRHRFDSVGLDAGKLRNTEANPTAHVNAVNKNMLHLEAKTKLTRLPGAQAAWHRGTEGEEKPAAPSGPSTAPAIVSFSRVGEKWQVLRFNGSSCLWAGRRCS